MKNKILIRLYIPVIDYNCELIIPTNESIKKVVDLIVKSVNDLMDDSLPENNGYCLFDPDGLSIYPYNAIVRDTNIENSKKIILL